MKLLSLFLAPTLALASPVFGPVSGTVTLLDGTPVAGAVVKRDADSTVTTGDGRFVLGRAAGIASRPARAILASSHLAVENGHPRLSYAGMDVAGRSSAVTRQIPSNSSRCLAARAFAASDTLKVYWKGKRLTVQGCASDTVVTLRIDTAWMDDAGIPWNPRIAYGSHFDARDGQTYRTVTIGAQTWMAQNLNRKVDSSWTYEERAWQTGELLSDSVATGSKYGRLYLWSAAMGLNDTCNRKSCASQVSAKHQGVCPAGWHVPSDTEWSALQIEADGHLYRDGIWLKSTGDWSTSQNGGWDCLGFRALPAGERDIYQHFTGKTYAGNWWAGTETYETKASGREMGYYQGYVSDGGMEKTYAQSLRCARN